MRDKLSSRFPRLPTSSRNSFGRLRAGADRVGGRYSIVHVAICVHSNKCHCVTVTLLTVLRTPAVIQVCLFAER